MPNKHTRKHHPPTKRGDLMEANGVLGIYSHCKGPTAYYWLAIERDGKIYYDDRGLLMVNISNAHRMPDPEELTRLKAELKAAGIAHLGNHRAAGPPSIRTITAGKSRNGRPSLGVI